MGCKSKSERKLSKEVKVRSLKQKSKNKQHLHTSRLNPVENLLTFLDCETNCDMCNNLMNQLKQHLLSHNDSKERLEESNLGVISEDSEAKMLPTMAEVSSITEGQLSHEEAVAAIKTLVTVEEKPKSDDIVSNFEIFNPTLASNSVIDDPLDLSVHSSTINKSIFKSTPFVQTTKMDRRIFDLENTKQSPFCRILFDKSTNLNNHITRIQKLKEISNCQLCGRQYKSKIDLVHHQSKPHRYQCNGCQKCFSRKEYFDEHVKNHENYNQTNNVVQPAILASDLPGLKSEILPDPLISEEQKPQKSKKKYPCNVCGKSLSSNMNLINHKRFHSLEPLECAYCGKIFKARGNLTVHMRTHTGEKPFECSICSKTFSSQSNLKQHKYTHAVEKPHKCDVCDKMFNNKRSLVVHKRIHTGEKPYKCQECNASFRGTAALRTHIKKCLSK